MTGVEMVGKGKVTVYINGRKSHFTGNSLKGYLESLPAEEIMNIEITTMANSTFRAQDSGGSINIILKKSELEGMKGSISLTDRQTGYRNYWEGNGFINYKKNKIDLTANVFSNKYKNFQTAGNQYDYMKENNRTNAAGTTKRDDLNNGIKINMDYHISENKILGIMANVSAGKNKMDGLNDNYYQSMKGSTADSISRTERNNSADIYQINANVNYYIRLNKKKDVLNWDFDFLRYKNKQSRVTGTSLLTPNYTFIRSLDPINQKQDQTITNGTAKVDYQLNSAKIVQIKTGAEIYSTRSEAKELFSNSTENSTVNMQNHKFTYTETVSAGYIQLSKEWGKVSAMIGGRLEYCYGKGNIENAPEKDFSRKDWNIFPSAAINYSPNDNNSFSLSFSSGIRRPEFTLLNPFKIYTSETVYRENNPFLKNMKTYNFDFTYVLKNKYIIQISQFKSKNAWSLFRVPLPSSNITKELFDNYGDGSITNLNFMWNESLFDGIWYVNYSIGGYYATSKGKIENTTIDVSSYVPNIYLSNSLLILPKWKLRAMITYYFMGKEKLPSVTRKPTHDLGFRINKQIGNLNLSAGVNDILNSKIKESYVTQDYRFISEIKNNRRNFWISATYNFGNQKVKGARNRRTNTVINRRIN